MASYLHNLIYSLSSVEFCPPIYSSSVMISVTLLAWARIEASVVVVENFVSAVIGFGAVEATVPYYLPVS